MKSNLQHLKELTDSLCSTKKSDACEELSFETLIRPQQKESDLNEVVEAIRFINQEFFYLKTEISNLKKQVNLIKEND